ncbi:hypothetical protein CYMTET_28268 [Cymbomonas tetramitiformis]|uniref:Uncharacterized protein n=1 Tax=Cymbomonas tetramitiformis TaxID=36881 RepID=A0AAE0FNH4_9CHLO|nr:hypothetical protein CYMTET_28268 [Cymbomonas tetramitiformis]
MGGYRNPSLHPQGVLGVAGEGGCQEEGRERKVEGVNMEVLTFGFKGKEKKTAEGEEGEGEGEGEGERTGGRITSTMFWDKGLMTSDASFAAVAEASRKRLVAAEGTQSRKREAAAKELERAGKYAKLAKGAQAKLLAARNHVQHSKLVKDELVGLMRTLGQTPASSARKGDLELQLQELLGQPGKNGPCGYIF